MKHEECYLAGFRYSHRFCNTTGRSTCLSPECKSHPPSMSHWWASTPGDNVYSVRAVAVGTAISRCPPHGPVRALLVHTVLTSDVWIFGVETCIRIGVQDLHRWQQGFQAGRKALPSHAMSLASAPQRLQPTP